MRANMLTLLRSNFKFSTFPFKSASWEFSPLGAPSILRFARLVTQILERNLSNSRIISASRFDDFHKKSEFTFAGIETEAQGCREIEEST